MGIIPTRSSLVYLASPIATYNTPRYEEMLTRTRRLVPEAETLAAHGLFDGPQGWQMRWPAILATLSDFVFFTDSLGWIGKGVYSELSDAYHAALPIWLLTDDGALHDAATFGLSEVNEADWRYYARAWLMAEAETQR